MEQRGWVPGIVILGLICGLLGIHTAHGEEGQGEMTLMSPSLGESAPIPRRYTCDGEDISPPLSWDGVPGEAKALVLICEDPDAPRGTWVHWVVYDLPPESKGLPGGLPPHKLLSSGGKQGLNDFGRIGYGGPCPPMGVHRYVFSLYALDRPTGLPPGATRAMVGKAMEGHVVGMARIVGRYARKPGVSR